MEYSYLFYILKFLIVERFIIEMVLMIIHLVYQLVLAVISYFVYKEPFKEKKYPVYMSILYGWPIILTFLIAFILIIDGNLNLKTLNWNIYLILHMIVYFITTLIYVISIFLKKDYQHVMKN